MRSVYLHKDKSIFQLDKLPVERFAASLGLPGAPKIKFLTKAAASTRKNVNRDVENTGGKVASTTMSKEGDSGEDSGEEEDESEDEGSSDAGSGHEGVSKVAVNKEQDAAPTESGKKVGPPTHRLH